MKNFEINEDYVRDVTIYKEYSMYQHIAQEDLTPEQLFKILKGEDRCSSTSNDDHPEFKKLRNELEALGYIECQRSWWNGDRVLKPFRLNGKYFKKGEQFASAPAMRWHLKIE